LEAFDSISEIVELVTPARFASSRWERLWAMRRWRSLPPISTDMASPVPDVRNSENLFSCILSFQLLGVNKKRTCSALQIVASIGQPKEFRHERSQQAQRA